MVTLSTETPSDVRPTLINGFLSLKHCRAARKLAASIFFFQRWPMCEGSAAAAPPFLTINNEHSQGFRCQHEGDTPCGPL